MDIGGDDRGAYALGRFVPSIIKENNYRMVFVANCYRPLTRTAAEALEIMREIEAACKLKFTDIINNSNLGEETMAETVLSSVDFINELSEISGLPIFAHTVKQGVANELKGTLTPVIALNLQKKYFA